MIDVVFRKKEQDIVGFKLSGHAGYAKSGKDIVCAAVSALAINAVNSIEKLTTASAMTKQADGYLDYRLKNSQDNKARLLLKSFEYGIQSIEKEYHGKEYISIHYEEV